MSQLDEMLDWINANSALVGIINSGVTVIITFFTLVVTIIYVVATWRLVHSPYKSFIKPANVQVGKHMNIWFFTLENYGPGVAVNVEVKTKQEITIRKESNKREVFIYEKVVKLNGLTEIAINERKSYQLIGVPKSPIEVYITWSSITGKHYKSFWTVNDSGGIGYSNVKPLRFFWRACNRFKYIIFWPSNTYKKIEHLEHKYTIYLILLRLSKEGKLSYDYISDELNKNDNETKQLLNLMQKKKYISYDGQDAQILKEGEIRLEKLTQKYHEKVEN
ncbi:hypothetical protein [Saccharibacillus alkalitolerans]|uniref:CARDB domain-containing protein n=1 Tax=Saccharibacillus alkalitolerans TaxID=2705290 RepID=A0ABX0F9U3_9BACL|nr:hypothetical protein [Saccharibacillus alkalitolerans]NGZ77708.1 hypothetical protein [Saccharibacillus alkalitolerans]